MADIDNDLSDPDEEGNMMSRIKESPRTVSALIIILIVAAAIYAFSGNNNNEPEGDGTTAPVAVTTTGVEPTPEAEVNEEAEEPAATPTVAVATPVPVTQEQLAETARQLPEAHKTDAGYVEVAQAGDGITHLARRATTRWLAENQAGYAVTNEHRIFIEDYIQNHLGSERLNLGQEETISFDMIKEAVEAAQGLNAQQLNNLSHYTPALT